MELDGDIGVAEQLGAEAEQCLSLLARKMQLHEMKLDALSEREEAARLEVAQLTRSIKLRKDMEATYTREAAAAREELSEKSYLFQELTRRASERLSTRALQLETARLEALTRDLQAKERALQRELGAPVDEAAVQALLQEVQGLHRRFEKVSAEHERARALALGCVQEASDVRAVRVRRQREEAEYHRLLEEAVEDMTLLLVEDELSASVMDDGAAGDGVAAAAAILEKGASSESVEPGAGMQSPREPLVSLFANHPAGDGPATELAADRAEAVLAPWAMPAPLVSIIECSDTVSTEPLEVKPKVEYLAGDPVNSASSPTLPTGAEAPEHPVESSGAASGQEAAGARIRCKPLEQLVSHSPTAGTAPTAPEAAWRVPAPLPPPGFYPTLVPAQEFNHLSAYGYREQVPQPGPRPSAHELNTAEVASLREKVRQLEWDLELRDMKIADLKTHVEELNRLVGSTCTDLNHISVRESVPLAGRVLLRLLAGHKDRGGPVNPILQTFAIKMYSQSPAVYRYVRQTFGGTMPTENNVVAWKKLADRLKQLK